MCIKQQNNSLCSLGWMLRTCPKLTFHSVTITVFPYKIGQVHARGPVIIESCQFCYQLNKYVCFLLTFNSGSFFFGKKHLPKLVILFLWCFVFSNDNFFCENEWFFENDLWNMSPIQHKTPFVNLQWDNGMAWSTPVQPTHTYWWQ